MTRASNLGAAERCEECDGTGIGGHHGTCPVCRGAKRERYRTIVADPPWPFRWDGRAGGQRRNDTPMRYELMTLEEIVALPVGDLAEPDAHLYLWATPELHRRGKAVEVAEAWGFEVIHEIIWAKSNFGMGAFPRHAHEPLLVCRRGSLPFVTFDARSAGRKESR